MTYAFNQRTAVCTENPDCPRRGEHRVVSLPLVAGGVCVAGGLYCECGSKSEMRIVTEEE